MKFKDDKFSGDQLASMLQQAVSKQRKKESRMSQAVSMELFIRRAIQELIRSGTDTTNQKFQLTFSFGSSDFHVCVAEIGTTFVVFDSEDTPIPGMQFNRAELTL